MNQIQCFPFGRPVLPLSPGAQDARRVFLLGAVPGALHVAWQPPGAARPVAALPVDNEPEAFWAGADEEARLATWRRAVGLDEAKWGRVSASPQHNGAVGRWVDANVLAPLGLQRSAVAASYCLDTYRCSAELAGRLDDTYRALAWSVEGPQALLALQPGEDEVVRETLALHRARLRAELEAAAPRLLITLGNAPLRVLAQLVFPLDGSAPRGLSGEPNLYGRRLRVRIGGREAEWLPLAQPSCPAPLQQAHQAWVRHLSQPPPRTARAA